MEWKLIGSFLVMMLAFFAIVSFIVWAANFIHDFYVLKHNFEHLEERISDIEREAMEEEEEGK